MKKIIAISFFLMSLIAPLPAMADGSIEELGKCLNDSMNGKERKNLVKWVFLAISTHEVISPYSKATAADLDESNQYMGNLITRLLVDDCPQQVTLAYKEHGAQAIEAAFGVVGEVAMHELMRDDNVLGAVTAYTKYIDQAKIGAAFPNE